MEAKAKLNVEYIEIDLSLLRNPSHLLNQIEYLVMVDNFPNEIYYVLVIPKIPSKNRIVPFCWYPCSLIIINGFSQCSFKLFL